MNFDDMKPVTAGTNDRIDFYWPGPSDQRKEGMTITGEYLEKFTFNEGKPTESTVYKIRTKDGRIAGVDDMATIKSYIAMKVRLIFDPPSNSFVVTSYQKLIEEAAWRLIYQTENDK